MLTVVWVPVITITEKNSWIWEISYFWGIALPLVITSIMLFATPGSGMKFTNGTPIRSRGLWFVKAVYYILARIPWYSCIVIRFEVDPIQALWITPLSFIVIIILSLFSRSSSAASSTSGVFKSIIVK